MLLFKRFKRFRRTVDWDEDVSE